MNYIETELTTKFKEIKNKGWLRVPSKGFGENGLFFENLLGLKNNDLPIPDFSGIELKVLGINSKFPITLFSLSLNGPTSNELERFINKFGAYDYIFHDKKVMFITLNAKEYCFWGKYLSFKLFDSLKEKKIFIIAKHLNGKIIEKTSYWNYKSIENIVLSKLSCLCIVRCRVKFIHDVKYIKYETINFFKLKSFDAFLSAFRDGKIKIQIKYGVHKKGPKIGKPYDHGISFIINFDDLSDVFELCYFE